MALAASAPFFLLSFSKRTFSQSIPIFQVIPFSLNYQENVVSKYSKYFPKPVVKHFHVHCGQDDRRSDEDLMLGGDHQLRDQ